MKTVSFFSNDLNKKVEAEVVEERKHTLKLQLEDGRIIVKKRKQIKYAR